MKIFGFGAPEMILLAIPCMIIVAVLVIVIVVVTTRNKKANASQYSPAVQPIPYKQYDQAEELGKWRQLLDANAITLEEYNRKKDEILDTPPTAG
jgi:uncharacterized membrane protein